MKKIIFPLFYFIFVTIFVNAQNVKSNLNYPNKQKNYFNNPNSNEILKITNNTKFRKSQNNDSKTILYKPIKIIVDDSRHYSFTYDELGNKLTELCDYNGTVNLSKNTYTYDSKGNMLTNLYEIWENEDWVSDSRWTYTYDNNGNIIKEMMELLSNSVWSIYTSSTYSYDSEGRLIMRLDVESYSTIMRHIYTYNEQGNLIDELTEVDRDNAWGNFSHQFFSYDIQGNMLTDYNIYWSTYFNAWMPGWSYVYTYNENGKILTSLDNSIHFMKTYTYDNFANLVMLSYGWVSDSGYVFDSKVIYTYDSLGNRLTELVEGNSLITYTYDTQGNLLTRRYAYWNEAWLGFLDQELLTYTYDENGNGITVNNLLWYNEEWVPLTADLSLPYNCNDTIKYFASSISAQYASFTKINDELENINSFTLDQNYPNPFNPSTTIKYSIAEVTNVKLTIYDILGREVITLINSELHPGAYSMIWNATDKFGKKVTSGIYFYSLEAGKFTKTNKMLLIK